MIPKSKTALEQLTTAGRKRDFAARLASALIVAAVTLLLVGLVALLNAWLMLPVKARWAALVGIVALLLAGVWKLIHLWRRPTTLKQAALDFETAQPEVGCEVSTAAEYVTGARKVSAEYESELVDALGRQAANDLQQAPVPYQRRLVKPLVITGLVLFGFLLFLAVFPAAGTALKQVVAPWSRATFTSVDVKPGNLEIPVGSDLKLTNIFTGRLPLTAELQWREENQKDPTIVRLTEGTNGLFVHTLPNVRTSFVYRVSGSDAVSEEFTVTAYIPPAVQALQIELEYPEYTGLKPAAVAAADFSAVRGSRATLRVTPNVPLSRAYLRFTNGLEMELKSDGADAAWVAAVAVAKDTDYWIELFDQKGRRGTQGPHHVTAIPDAPPKVEIAEPGGDIRAAATNTIPLKLTASDDFGVADIKIIYHRLGQPEQELFVKIPGSAGSGAEVKGEAELDLSQLKLAEYELVAYHAVARDKNNLDGPGIGRSPVYFIEITNEEGAPCKSQPKPGQKVNLLIIQKQIIADTTALAKNDAPAHFEELAARQKDAVEFGRMYQTALARIFHSPNGNLEILMGAIVSDEISLGEPRDSVGRRS